MKTRQTILKTALWAIIGALVVVTVARFASGLGATTALNDATPWGFWIAFDVMSGVALAAGGFVMAATVYIFGRRRYRHFARPAILTAFLGYVAVGVGLTYDLGLPWHIWNLGLSPQPRSVLFEVAMCVMLYLTVLLLEFSPVVLEHRLFRRYPLLRTILRGLKRASIPLVITGIVLSTLHQSSLGSLFLIAPYRLHPLWYSPIIWVLFFVSAVGLGLMMVCLESFFSAWYFGHRLRMDLLSGLGKAAAVVLATYAALRLGDLAVRGVLPRALDGSWQSLLFIFELAVSALVPAILLASGRLRKSPAVLGACATMTVLGMIGYRFDACIVAFARPEGTSYFPSWMEVVVSLGIVAGAMLVFIFFVERLKVYPEQEHGEAARAPEARQYNPSTIVALLPLSLAGPRRYSLAALVAAAVALALLPRDALYGAEKHAVTPVAAPRTLDGLAHRQAGKPGRLLTVASARGFTPAGKERVKLLVLDGDRNGRQVLFHHDGHARSLGGQGSCARCHHQRLPFSQNTPCRSCHRDMYSRTDIFSHASHVSSLGGNAGCPRCHSPRQEVKSRETATACVACHTGMQVPGSTISIPEGGSKGYAPCYKAAMHGLCIQCHRQRAKQEPRGFDADLATCAGCHRDHGAMDLRSMAPYTSREARQ